MTLWHRPMRQFIPNLRSKKFFFFLQFYKNSVRAQKHHFIDPESMNQYEKLFNFTTTYAILIKLTADIYLNKIFCLEKSWGVTHRVQESVNKKTAQKDPKNQFFDTILTFINTLILYISDASSCMSSLVKISNKMDKIWGVLAKKPTKTSLK